VNDVRWVVRDAVLAIHAELLAEHGGLAGIRDESVLDAALARPRNKLAYEDAGLFALAAAYAFGLARDHAFNDGNKRLALSIGDVFLRLNGFALAAPEIETVATIFDLAAGELGEADLTEWIERHSKPLI